MDSAFILVGEKSGDLQGEAIIRSLLEKNPQMKISAVAGPLMRAHPIKTLEKMESLQVMGIVDVLSYIPTLIQLFRKINRAILQENPDVVILIDYAEFNLLLGKALKKAGYQGKIAQVVCPSVWAWRKGRMKTLERYFDHLFCLFPFEPPLFKETKLEATYIGHPLALTIQPQERPQKPLLTLFPGSRKKEVERNLPIQLAIAKRFLEKHPEFTLAISSLQPIQVPDAHLFPPSENREMMQKSTLAIAKSGTVNLELALYGVPTVVTYQMNRFDYFLVKHLFRIKLPHYCIVNILLNERVFPEHYGPRLDEEAIYQDLVNLPLEETSSKCRKLFSLFEGKQGAKEIVEVLFSFSL